MSGCNLEFFHRFSSKFIFYNRIIVQLQKFFLGLLRISQKIFLLLSYLEKYLLNSSLKAIKLSEKLSDSLWEHFVFCFPGFHLGLKRKIVSPAHTAMPHFMFVFECTDSLWNPDNLKILAQSFAICLSNCKVTHA